MNREEEIYLVEVLLLDIRLNWSDCLLHRLSKARELASINGLFEIVNRIDGFTEDLNSHWGADGRHFRTSYSNGGYEGLFSLHGLSNSYLDRSEEFKYFVDELVTCPKLIFEDFYN